MRLGIRGKEAVAVTLLALLIVATTTLIHLSQLSRVVVQEAVRQAELISRQIYAQTSRTLARTPGSHPQEALRHDPELRALLEASVGYSPHLVYALITDRAGRTILHTEREREGAIALPQLGLTGLIELDPASRFAALYRDGRVYETTLPLLLNGEPFGGIRLGVSTTLVRQELTAGVKQDLILAGVALPLAWLAALGLAHLILRPIRALTGEVDRMRRGEFEVGASLAGGDEFQELSSQLQRLGQELQADRTANPGERLQLQHVVDHLEDVVIFLNPERRVLFFNKVAEAMIGRPLLPPPHPLSPLIAVVAASSSAARDTTVALNQDGRVKEFLVSVFPVRDAARVMGTVVLLKDLESFKTVQSLISYSAKLAALGRLTSGVAHEVRNPLNAMMIHVELLRDRLASTPPDVQQSLDIIGSEVHRLDRVVQGFLRFMRPQELSLKALDLNALLGSVAALLEAEWQARGVHFQWDVDSALPPIRADEELLQLIRVSIADEGMGIPAENLEKVFKLYFTTKPDGSGIGLSIVFRIIQMHDGTIEARSENRQGTTMVVRLPVRQGA